MKKLCILVAIIFTAVVFMPIATAQAQDTYTVMIYLCGTDLETQSNAATADILEMLDAGLVNEGPVNVVIQTGGTHQWAFPDVFDASRSQRFLVSDDVYELDVDLGQLNMGDGQTLEDFIAFSMDNFPADRYSLILWDHGAGSTGGVCYDEITGDSLSIAEIRDALENGLNGHMLDFIGFDACLMATFEMASYAADYAKYMIASEELEPGTGWAYDAWLSALANDPAIDSVTLGSLIIDSMVDKSLEADPNDYVTLSMIDLDMLAPVQEAVKALAGALGEEMEKGQFPAISRVRSGMRDMGSFHDSGSDMIDMHTFAKGYENMAPQQSQAVAAAVTDAVVYSRYSQSVGEVSGMTILMPYGTRQEAPEYMQEYDPYGMMETYSGFINSYVDMLNGGDYQFASTQMNGLREQADSGIIGWFESLFETEDGWEDSGEYDNVYTLQLTQDEMTYLSYVEATLMLDVSDDDVQAYVDLGYVQDVTVDWDTGIVCGLFDGTWPTLEGQMVSMTDQIVTEHYIRSIIPANVNGTEQYLLVVFTEDHPYGLVVGYSQGYDDNGNPAKGYKTLQSGDVIVPLYELLIYHEDGDVQNESFEGDVIIVGADGQVAFGYEPVEPGTYQYAYCLNDVFGDYQFSDFVELSL